MQILRLPPYPLSVTYSVPDANLDYILVIEDVLEQSEVEAEVTSNSSSQVVYEITGDFVKYDKSYSLTIYEFSEYTSDNRGEVVVEDNLEISRPYVDPTAIAASYNATTATEIAKYVEYESLARTIIDNVTGGFYNKRSYLEVVGQGTDYVPVWDKTNKILKVYENAELVYDVNNSDGPALGSFNYVITKDKTAITKDPVQFSESLNRAERMPARFSVAPSDSITLFDTEDSGNVYTISGGVAFPEGFDYIFVLETGYRVVPLDIQDATKMLIEDIKCGKLDYYKRYVKNYSTDQFKIEYDKRMIEGTGNILVDKILSKYVVLISSPRML